MRANSSARRDGVVSTIVIVVVLAALVVWVLWTGLQKQPPRTDGNSASVAAAEPQYDAAEVEFRDPANATAVGKVDAPVGLIVFTDAQCPQCAAWHNETLPELMKYVESGDLLIEWRHINVYGEASHRAALAATAAGKQGALLEFQNELFTGGKVPAEKDLTDQALEKTARSLKLDMKAFTRDMSAAETQKDVQANESQAAELGFTGTPAFILDGRALIGEQATDVFVDTIVDLVAERS